MGEIYKILVINPGSTSTKIGFFENQTCIYKTTLNHSAEDLENYPNITDQYPFRKLAILDYLDQQKIDLNQLNAVVGRGGLMKPVKGGVYSINKEMLIDLKDCKYGKHASNLGALIAYELATPRNIPAFIVNPVVVDEFEPLARYSGIKEIQRKSAFHALNQKAIAHKHSEIIGKEYNDLNLIIVHLGGGISVGAHKKGSVIDVNNALEEGPFSPERSGTVPIMQLVEMCFSGYYTREQIEKKLVGKGGLVSYLGTADAIQVQSMIANGDKKAEEIFEAMAYQVSKEIGAFATVLEGKVDYILLTGGLSNNKVLTNWIIKRVEFIAPVKVYPGEDELLAMAEGAFKSLNKTVQINEYR